MFCLKSIFYRFSQIVPFLILSIIILSTGRETNATEFYSLQNKIITVSGEALRTVEADTIVLTGSMLIVQTLSKDTEFKVADYIEQLTAALRARISGDLIFEITQLNVQTSPGRSRTSSDSNRTLNTTIGFHLTAELPRNAYSIVDTLLEIGAVKIQKQEYIYSDQTNDIPDLEEKALQNAREKASRIAQENGLLLGEVISVRTNASTRKVTERNEMREAWANRRTSASTNPLFIQRATVDVTYQIDQSGGTDPTGR